MPLRNPSRYSILTGIFLLGSVALAIAIAFSLTTGVDYFYPKRSFIVRFPMSDGTPGLKPESPVTLGGQHIGRVSNISFDQDRQNVLVKVLINSEYQLHEHAVVSLERPLLGSQSSINISSLGSDNPLAEGAAISGQPAPGMLAQLGLSREQVQKIVADAQESLKTIRKLLDDNKDKISALFDNVSGVSKSLAEHWPDWEQHFSHVLKNADDFSDMLGPTTANANDLLDDARGAFDKICAVIDENRAGIRETIAGIDDGVKTINEKSLVSLNSVLSKADVFMGQANTWAVDLTRTVANLRLTSDQTKRAISEIRAQPWRLFYSPSKKDLEADVVFWAADAYADAVSDLRAATESMQNTLSLAKDARPGIAPGPEVIAANLKLLQESAEKYHKAEQDLLDVLRLRAGGKPPETQPPAETPLSAPNIKPQNRR